MKLAHGQIVTDASWKAELNWMHENWNWTWSVFNKHYWWIGWSSVFPHQNETDQLLRFSRLRFSLDCIETHILLHSAFFLQNLTIACRQIKSSFNFHAFICHPVDAEKNIAIFHWNHWKPFSTGLFMKSVLNERIMESIYSNRVRPRKPKESNTHTHK